MPAALAGTRPARHLTSRLSPDPDTWHHDDAPGHHLLCPHVMAHCWLVIPRASQSPGCLPPRPSLSCLALSAAGGPAYGSGGNGALVQHKHGTRRLVWRQSQTACWWSGPGDTYWDVNVRSGYGTTWELAQERP